MNLMGQKLFVYTKGTHMNVFENARGYSWDGRGLTFFTVDGNLRTDYMYPIHELEKVVIEEVITDSEAAKYK